MLSKQFLRTSLRAAKISVSSVSPATRISIASGLRPSQSTRYDATPIRWLSSSPRPQDEQPVSTDAQPEKPTPRTADEVELPALYLSNLPFSVTEESLTEFLRERVPVKKVDVVRNAEGAARGFGFAKFLTLAEVEAALPVVNGIDYQGRQIVAAVSQRRPVISDASTQLFMSGFPTQGEADEAELRHALQTSLGVQPRSIRFHKFPGGFLKGTGHIEFEDVATLEKAISKLHELGPDQPVTVSGHSLTLVKARPLLQSRTPGRGGFGNMRGRGGFGGPGFGGPGAGGAGYYGAYGSAPAAPMAGGYPGPAPGGYPGPAPGGYQGPGYEAPYNASYPPGSPAPGGPGGYGGYGGYGSQSGGGPNSGNSPY